LESVPNLFTIGNMRVYLQAIPEHFKQKLNMQKYLIAFGFFLVSFLSLNAQTSEAAQLVGTRQAIESAGSPTINEGVFFADQESKTIFIDFEKLNVNLSNIVVKDILGGVVFKAEVSELPVDAIYELDMSRMSPGTYEIELRSYTGVIRKTVTMP